MPEQIPTCKNALKYKDHASDMRMKQELSDAWIFQCAGCELVNVVSKQGVRDKSRFEQAAQKREQEAERIRQIDSRRKIFA